MSETLRDEIIASESAKRMVSRVSPIYDNSYVGLWMFEAIGLEYDMLWEIVRTMPDQLFPSTVTWAIELWEYRYGIIPLPSQTLEERRRALVSARSMKGPFVPATLKKYIWNLSGRESEVLDHVSYYTFGVYITNTEGMVGIDYDALIAYINRNKPSHMSYELALQSVATIAIGVETGYWRFRYSRAGQVKAGQLPHANISVRTDGAMVNVHAAASGHRIPYTLAGTVPRRNITFGSDSSQVDVDSDSSAYRIPYKMAGTVPYDNIAFGATDDSIVADTSISPYRFEYPATGENRAGELPDYTITGGVSASPIRASPEGQSYKTSYIPCGTRKTGTGIL